MSGLKRMPYLQFKETVEYRQLRDSHDNDPRVLAWMMWRNMNVLGVLDFGQLSPDVLKLWHEKERAVLQYEADVSALWTRLSREQSTEPKLVWDGEMDDEE